MTHVRHVGRLPQFTHGQIEQMVVSPMSVTGQEIVVLNCTQSQTSNEQQKTRNLLRASDHGNGLQREIGKLIGRWISSESHTVYYFLAYKNVCDQNFILISQ